MIHLSYSGRYESTNTNVTTEGPVNLCPGDAGTARREIKWEILTKLERRKNNIIVPFRGILISGPDINSTRNRFLEKKSQLGSARKCPTINSHACNF